MSYEQTRDVPDYIRPYFDEVSQFQHYYEYEKSIRLRRDIDDRFICLKGFSSSTPMINSATFGRECLGGGFYFRYKGHGIVVDPGIGFTSLMHRNSIFIDDIDTVIVTHSHLDHNCDVGMLSALKYDYNRNKGRERSFFENFFDCSIARPHRITWYMDEETIQSNQSILQDDVHPLSECCDGNEIILSESIKLSAIKTKHVDDSDKTYGIKLCFDSDVAIHEWGYTSDTCFFDELGDFFKAVSFLIFNISDIYLSDVEGRKPKHSHLGFDGSVNLLEKAMPRAALASEFCCTNGDYRHEMVRALREFSKVHVLPSDPGLTIDIGGGFIKCSLCGKYAPMNCIRTAHPAKEFGTLQYICPDCLL